MVNSGAVRHRAAPKPVGAADGATVGINTGEFLDELGRRELLFWQNWCVSEGFANSQAFHFAPIPEKSIVADFHEAVRQDMHEEPADELHRGNGHDFPSAPVFVVLPFEGDAAALDIQNPAVGDGDPVGISAEVIHNTGSVLEGRFAVDKPIFFVKRG